MSPASHVQPDTAALPLVQRILRSHDLVMQAGRYGFVSVLALACDFVVFLALAKSGAWPAIAGAAGYSFGLVLHFVLSTWIVFDAQASQKSIHRLFGEFAASGCAGLILTMGIISLMTGQLHAAPVVAKLTAVIVSFVVVFLLRRGVVFASRGRA